MFTLFILILFACFPSNHCFSMISFAPSVHQKNLHRRETKDNSLRGTINDKVYLGSKVKISCTGKKNPPKNVVGFKWEHNKMEISSTNGYIIDDNGGLTISAVKLQDAGIFICTASESSELKTWKHEIKVVQLPSASLHVYLVYSVKQCSNVSEDTAKSFIEAKLKGKVCTRNECKVSLIHSSCHFEELSSPILRVTVPLVAPEVPTGSCDEDCTRNKVNQLEETVKKKVVELVMEGKGLKLPGAEEMAISYFESKEDMMCDPGFEIIEESSSSSICVLCTPGHFLEKARCIPCHLNQYTDKYGATECSFCDKDRLTNIRGATSEDDCKFASLTTFWILTIIALFPSILCLTCCCWSIRYFAGESSIARAIDACCYFVLCDFVSLKKSSKLRAKRSVTIREPPTNDSISQLGESEDPSQMTSSTTVYSFENVLPAPRRGRFASQVAETVPDKPDLMWDSSDPHKGLLPSPLLPITEPQLRRVGRDTLAFCFAQGDVLDPTLNQTPLSSLPPPKCESPAPNDSGKKTKSPEEKLLLSIPKRRAHSNFNIHPSKRSVKPLLPCKKWPDQAVSTEGKDHNWLPCDHKECNLWTSLEP